MAGNLNKHKFVNRPLPTSHKEESVVEEVKVVKKAAPKKKGFKSKIKKVLGV